MTVGEGSGIFVSYRRQESSHLAGRLADRLADRFGEGQVFIDVDTIEPGVDFAEEIFRAVAGCEVLLAIIGPNWLASADERGGRRLDDPDDIVRLEIEAALARGVRVIPILIEGAVMPRRDDLPESLASLARRQALLIRHESFRYDVGHLVTAIERILTPASGPIAVPRASDAHGVRSAGNAYADDESDESNLEASGDRQLAFRGWTEEELERLSESPQASVQRVAKMLDLLSKSPGQPIVYTAVLIGAGRVRVKSSRRAGGLLAGVIPSVVGVRGPCGPAVGLDGGGLPVTPAGLWDLSPFYSLAAGT